MLVIIFSLECEWCFKTAPGVFPPTNTGLVRYSDPTVPVFGSFGWVYSDPSVPVLGSFVLGKF